MSHDPAQQLRLEAARWMAALYAGEIGPRAEAEFLEWQRRSPEHARAIAQLTDKLGALQQSSLGQLNGRQLRQTLDAPSSRRQFLKGALAVGASAVAVTLFNRMGSSGFAWPGDLYTGIGERRAFTLPDGSELTLNAASRAHPDIDREARHLRIQAGEGVVKINDNPNPMLIEVAGALLRTPRNTVLVRHEPQGGYVVALDADLQLHTPQGWTVLKKGHWARGDGTRAWASGLAQGTDTLWLRGLLEADAQPLQQVVDALRAYRHGVIQVSPAVADLRISGLLPLDDSDHALSMLASIAPIKVQRLTDLWVRIEPA